GALGPAHRSVVQALPSSVHAVVLDLKVSVGQVVLVPVQLSAASHTLPAARHTAPAFPAGCWQVTLVPSHWSRVQALVSAVQVVPLAFLASVGQALLVPVQVSVTSQGSAVARHSVPALPVVCVQVALLPSPLFPYTTLFRSVHAVVLDLKVSAGQVVLVPVQL